MRAVVILISAVAVVGAGRMSASAEVADGLLLRYDLTQSTGTVVTDASGNGRDGSLQGDATWMDGGGVSFGGTNGHIKLPNDIMSGLQQITVSADVRIDPAQNTPYMIWALGNTNASGVGNGYLFATGDSYRTSIASGNWSTEKTAASSAALPRGVWQSIAYTLTGDGVATEYLNGKAVATQTGVTLTPGSIGNGSTSANYLGRSVYTADAYLKGQVRNFRIYNRALSATEAAFIALTDGTRVAADKAALTLGDTSAVTGDLSLPATGPAYGSAISWSSSDPAVISNQGVVTRPAADAHVTLTATVSSGDVTETRDFAVTVLADLSDTAKAAEAAASLTVVNIDDVRGNLTLPETGRYQSRISWASADPATVGTTGEVHRPAPGGAVRQVGLTATVRVGSAVASRTLTAVVPPLPAPAPLTGYAFAYFTGNTVAGEKIYFAASEGNNALRWKELNGGNPALASTLGTKGLRDPFLIRSPEGDKFYLIATDLSIGGGTSWDASQRQGSRYLEVWESTDLVNWGQQRHVLVSPPTAGNTWAPEAFWSAELGSYVVFWASKIYAASDPGHTGDTYNKMLYATTRDFVTFSQPKVWQDFGSSRIDSTVIKDGGVYHRFTKDEGGVTGCSDIIQERADSLVAVDDASDPAWDKNNPNWKIVASCIGKNAGTSAVEGPTAFRANDGDTSGSKYYLFVDEYGGRGYIPLGTDDLNHPQWKVPPSYTLPASPRHGTVLPITQAELNRLAKVPNPLPAGADGLVARYPLATDAADASGNGNNAQLVGGASFAGGSLTFGGTDGYVRLPDNAMAGLDAMTVSAETWIDPAQQTPYFLWGMGNTSSGAGNGYVFSTGDSAYRAAIASGNWSTEQNATGSGALSRGAWHTLTYTIGGGKSTLYLDGRQVGANAATTLTPGSIGGGVTTANYIGRSDYTADHYFKGKMRDFRLYNRALSADEVARLGANATRVTDVTLDSLKAPALIDSDAGTIVLPVKAGTDLRHLAPAFTVAAGSTVAGADAGDWSAARRITVTSPDGTTRGYTVTTHVMRSPVLPGLYADPNIVRFGDTYYIYATTDGFDGWSGTTFTVWSSTDLANWTKHGTILDLADVSWAHTNAWAPTAAYANGKYYFYFCAAGNIGVATSDSPLGPFTDSGKPLVDRKDFGGAQQIDPAVFTDDDGQNYLYWGNSTAYVAPLNADLTSLGARQTITGLTDFREGLFMNKRKGVYYLTYSIDDTRSEDYRVGYATATSPYGPFTARGVILSKDRSLGILGTGHSSIIQVPGTDDWYIAYHRFAIPGGDGTHRETTIDRLSFDADGLIKPVVPTLESVDPLAYTGVLPTSSLPASGWLGAGATLTLTGGSGNSELLYALTPGNWVTYTGPVALPAGSYTVSYRARGDNRILSAPVDVRVQVDAEPPMTAASVTTAGTRSTVTLTAQDPESGVAAIAYRVGTGDWQTYQAPFTVNGVQQIEFRGTDRAGNTSAAQRITVPLVPDVTGPTVTAATTPARPTGTDGWYTGAVSVIVTAEDPSGVASREYRVDGGPWRAYTAPIAVHEGVTTVSVRATDSWGNRSPVSVLTVRRDTVKPAAGAKVTSAKKSATVRLTASDATSGVRLVQYRVDRDRTWHTYTGPLTVTGRGLHTVLYRAIDRAGNAGPPLLALVQVR
ncbi:family 43 glycosylhydrolase [Actinoplanes subtropicus]|uniref:family 43 glycosylhydrolase n=1 Tax=Actinoplanes subtropicus TaxID=543632 RepID=UPI000689E91B|nr:family 43 glycosylhydrolase [Actinoplanes subtropicus]